MKKLVINASNFNLFNRYGGQKIEGNISIKPNFKNINQGLGLHFDPEYTQRDGFTKIEVMYEKEVEEPIYNEHNEVIGNQLVIKPFKLPTSFDVRFNHEQINAVKGVVEALATDTFDRFYLAILLMVKNHIDTAFGSEIVEIV
jgi:hypothetical protein